MREFETNGHGVVCDFCMGQVVCGTPPPSPTPLTRAHRALHI